MSGLAFSKYEGLGNDFVVIDAATEALLDPALAIRMCDRHFGIGADGVLLVLPPVSQRARARMVVLNADGSRPEMCGNGVRCVALHLALRDNQQVGSLTIDTDAGPRAITLEREGGVASAAVEMGQALVEAELSRTYRGRQLSFMRVSMGNPHAICFDADLNAGELDELGPLISAAVPGGTNVESVTMCSAREFELLVWERGVGRTLACGTGACAAAVAAAVSGRSPFDLPIHVSLPGGALEITVRGGTLAVTMSGPARLVFSGESRIQ
ncbi:MAG TPA: diaminopimelate epimerase [Polyangiaceae bacterium]|jgi:diaminopimelate epimerase